MCFFLFKRTGLYIPSCLLNTASEPEQDFQSAKAQGRTSFFPADILNANYPFAGQVIALYQLSKDSQTFFTDHERENAGTRQSFRQEKSTELNSGSAHGNLNGAQLSDNTIWYSEHRLRYQKGGDDLPAISAFDCLCFKNLSYNSVSRRI
ncbi:MAG: hypothetical protein PUA61_01970 [Succinatimonas hippei]|nr:hypothetical protein [Succinatimonas hippei]